MVGYESLANHYKTNWALMQHHKYSLSELEAMIPWERQLYVGFLKEYIDEEEKKAKDREAAARAKRKAR